MDSEYLKVSALLIVHSVQELGIQIIPEPLVITIGSRCKSSVCTETHFLLPIMFSEPAAL